MESKDAYTQDDVGKILARAYVLGTLAQLAGSDTSLLEKIAEEFIPRNVRPHAILEISRATATINRLRQIMSSKAEPEARTQLKGDSKSDRIDITERFDHRRAKKIRVDSGTTQTELARIAGYKNATSIFNYECGFISENRTGLQKFGKYMGWLKEHGY